MFAFCFLFVCSYLDFVFTSYFVQLQVWAVLKPGFLALLDDPFDTELLDIIIFNAPPPSNGNGQCENYLASQIKERNPLRYTFWVSCVLLYCYLGYMQFENLAALKAS